MKVKNGRKNLREKRKGAPWQGRPLWPVRAGVLLEVTDVVGSGAVLAPPTDLLAAYASAQTNCDAQ